MRLISQDGMIDVSYEQVSVEQKGNEIWCGYSTTMSKHCIAKCFAKYSTEDKASNIIESLRSEFTKHTECSYQMGQCVNLYMNVGFVPPKVFIFPKESELENGDGKMDDDLISRKETISVIEQVFKKYNIGFANGNGGFADAIPKSIESISAAYDVDKVVEQMEEYIRESSNADYNRAMIEAIEIVKNGVE